MSKKLISKVLFIEKCKKVKKKKLSYLIIAS